MNKRNCEGICHGAPVHLSNPLSLPFISAIPPPTNNLIHCHRMNMFNCFSKKLEGSRSRRGRSGHSFLTSAAGPGVVSVSLILAIILLAMCTLTASSGAKARMKICLKNCGQCKRIYGDYFEGRRCADSCILQKGRFIPDCHDDYSISDFISKLE